MPQWEAALWGALGIIIGDMLKFVGGRFGEIPAWVKQYYYWISLALLVAMAAAVTYALAPGRIIDALAIGYAAPAILSRLLGISDKSGQSGGGPERVPGPSESPPASPLLQAIRLYWGR